MVDRFAAFRTPAASAAGSVAADGVGGTPARCSGVPSQGDGVPEKTKKPQGVEAVRNTGTPGTRGTLAIADKRKEHAANDDWVHRYRQRVRQLWKVGGMPKRAAARRAYGEIVDDWHVAHPLPPKDVCAGCNQPIGTKSMQLADGTRVHFDNFNCLITYGRYWRRRAAHALALLGIHDPDDID